MGFFVGNIRRRSRSLAAAVVGALVGVLGSVGLPTVAQAAGETPFGIEYQTNANGSLMTIGNTLLTCAGQTSSGGVPCETALQQNANTRNSLNNNSYSMEYLNAGSGDTAAPNNWPNAAQDASGQLLNLPPGAEVLWAGLYWGASLHNNTSSINQGGVNGNEENMWRMSFKTPDGQYQTVEADKQFGPLTDSFWAYQGMANVTDMVKASGNGTYWGANVESATGPAGVAGTGNYAGWSLVVVYTAPGEPMRNLTVFDGLVKVSDGHPQTITVDGFTAPDYGPRQTDLTMVAYEGDLAQGGDQAILNDIQLASAVSPGNNFFNSSLDNYGTNVTTGTPSYTNTMGFDIKNITVGDAIPNGAHSATFQFNSTGDTYYPGVLGLAIDLYGPDYSTSTKTVNNITGNNPAHVGDILEYTLTYNNTGEDAAKNAIVTDQIPAGTQYVANSLRVNGAKKSDAAGDDTGSVVGNTVTAHLGKGATAGSGGTMACSGSGCAPDGTQTQTVRFRVKVTEPGITVTNIANINYLAATTNEPGSYGLSAQTPVTPVADVAMAKSVTPGGKLIPGSAATFNLIATNYGPNEATEVVVTDQVPSNWIIGSPLPNGCTVGGTPATITCQVGNLASGANASFNITGTINPATTATSITNVAKVTSDTFDPTLTNNTAGVTVPLASPQADLVVTKTPSGDTYPGGEATWTVTMVNNGPSTAVKPSLNDILANAQQATNIQVTPGDTPGLNCRYNTSTAFCNGPATMAPGEMWTVTVSGVLDSELPVGTEVLNNAKGNSSTPLPPNPRNTAPARITVTAPDVDISLIKTTNSEFYYPPSSPSGAAPLEYTLTATNNGPNATTVNFSDTFSNVNFSSVTAAAPGQVQVTDSGWDVTCPSVPIAADGGIATCVITVVPTDAAPNPLPNVANVTWPGDEVGVSDFVLTPRTRQLVHPTLEVQKTSDKDTFEVGGSFSYQIQVEVPDNPNAEPPTVPTIVTDTLPAGFVIDTVQPSQGACTHEGSPAEVNCNLGAPDDLVKGVPAFITVTGTVGQGAQAGPVTNTATATAGELSESASVPGTVVKQADLRVEKNAAQSVVSQNGTMTFTMRVTNAGPAEVESATLTDTLPAGFEVVEPYAQGCGPATPEGDHQVVTCTVTGPDGGPLPVDASVLIPVTINTKVSATAAITPDGQPLYNVARVTPPAGVTDVDDSNNEARVPISVTGGQLNLALYKLAVPNQPGSGNVTYNITATNITTNNLSIENPVLTEQLPAGAQLVSVGSASVTQPDGDVPPANIEAQCGTPDANNLMVCSLVGAVPPGTQVSIPVNVNFPNDLPTGNRQVNTAKVTLPPDSPYASLPLNVAPLPPVPGQPVPPSHPVSNAAESVITVWHRTELAIQKALVSDKTIQPGQQVTWHLTAWNNGDQPVPHVDVSDVLPAGTTFVSANIVSGGTATDRTCPNPLTPAGSEVDEREVVGCDVGTLQPGAAAVVAVTVTVKPETRGQICNLGLVGSRLLDARASSSSAPVCTMITVPVPITPGVPAAPGQMTDTGVNLWWLAVAAAAMVSGLGALASPAIRRSRSALPPIPNARQRYA